MATRIDALGKVSVLKHLKIYLDLGLPNEEIFDRLRKTENFAPRLMQEFINGLELAFEFNVSRNKPLSREQLLRFKEWLMDSPLESGIKQLCVYACYNIDDAIAYAYEQNKYKTIKELLHSIFVLRWSTSYQYFTAEDIVDVLHAQAESDDDIISAGILEEMNETLVDDFYVKQLIAEASFEPFKPFIPTHIHGMLSKAMTSSSNINGNSDEIMKNIFELDFTVDFDYSGLGL